VTDWISTLVPIGTFIAGSLVTLAGQALHDRRIAERERRARREDFRIANFDMHRGAMLEMQELVRDCYETFINEKLRRENEGDNEYFDTHLLRDALSAMQATRISDDELLKTLESLKRTEAHEDPSKLRPEIEQLKNQMIESVAARKATTDTLKTYNKLIEKRSPFLEQYVAFIQRLRLCMYRSGSNSVVTTGEEFIQAIFRWDEFLSSHSQDERVQRVKAAHRNLQRALANALAFGPYDTFGKRQPERRKPKHNEVPQKALPAD
jgi:hypothetical protein